MIQDRVGKLKHRYCNDRSMFASIFDDKVIIPWRVLSIGDYLRYIREENKTPEDIDNEIFLTCVQDEFYTKNIDTLKAGIVTTTVQAILTVSSLRTNEDFSYALNYCRERVYTNVYDDLVIFITNAFPSYKPSDLYSMNIEDFMHTVALAEKKLLSIGAIGEPLDFAEPETQSQTPRRVEPPKNNTLREKWLETQKEQEKTPKRKEPLERRVQPPIYPAADEALSWDGKKRVITEADASEMALASGFSGDYELNQQKMLDETIGFYQDYIDIIKSGDNIVPETIKTVEQRIEEAEERKIKNKEEYEDLMLKKKAQIEKEEERINKLFEKGKKGIRRRRKKK